MGAGMSGLAMGAKLKSVGEHDFVILEKSADLGGTWLDNRYPGAQCDVRSHLYSFSFAPNPNWSRRYATAPEIHAYMHDCANQLGLQAHCRFGTNLRSAIWQTDQSHWLLTTSAGMQLSCDQFICSTAPLNEPKWPQINGIETFQGQLLHTARWDPNFNPRDKKIAIIGNAASAVQVVPELAKVASQLTVFQRTPNWIIPRNDKAYSRWQLACFKLPFVGRAVVGQVLRGALYIQHEINRLGFTKNSFGSRLAKRTALHHMAKQIPDVALRERVTPTFPVGCKRVLLSDSYYPALQQNNVRLETQAITQITSHGIQVGKVAPCAVMPFDVIVCATGFDLEAVRQAVEIQGINGVTLAQQWQLGPMAYKGTCVAGMPNFYMLLGPNTATGHTSTLLYIEAQTDFIVRALRLIKQRKLKVMVLRSGVMEAFDQALQAKMANTVWSESCVSWYKRLPSEGGRVITIWPGFTGAFKRLLASEQFEDFEFF